jgi:hypothetical protein
VTRQQVLLVAAAAIGLGMAGLVQFHGGVRASAGKAQAGLKVGAGKAAAAAGHPALKAGLANATGDPAPNRWSAPAWSLAQAGAAPLRQNHPLFRRPPYIGHNRHKVMCDGWNGWYYDAPENEVL